ncbi:hypothetical protein J437_LFUL018692 [Ladona fulva]|uniref:Uncharacterized protein n=1 Tax=Ladona fulva TaxID=123851 RepID=A0A8K0KQ63_LADFU|nr:hypothetical protein J437_LFUL018692 [Ladona fulva]
MCYYMERNSAHFIACTGILSPSKMSSSYRKIVANPELQIHEDFPQLRRARLKSRKPPIWPAEQLQQNNYDSRDQWTLDWNLRSDKQMQTWFKSYNCDIPGIELTRKEWTALVRANVQIHYNPRDAIAGHQGNGQAHSKRMLSMLLQWNMVGFPDVISISARMDIKP